MQSRATTPAEYLDSLPDDRRAALEAVRAVILANVDGDIEEGMQYGMLGYYVPHRVFPRGYHCDPRQPVPYINLASQKNHMALYLFYAYGSRTAERFIREGFAKAGKRVDMGKSCLRFKSVDDLALDVLAESIRHTPTARHLQTYVLQAGPNAWTKGRVKAASAKPVAVRKKPPAKKAPAKRSAAKSSTAKK